MEGKSGTKRCISKKNNSLLCYGLENFKHLMLPCAVKLYEDVDFTFSRTWRISTLTKLPISGLTGIGWLSQNA